MGDVEVLIQAVSVADLVRKLRNDGEEAQKRFLVNGGWSLITSWLKQTYSCNNQPVLHDIFNLILEFPRNSLENALLGAENPMLPVLGMIAEEVVRKEGGAQGTTAQFCLKILQHWKRVIKEIKEEKGRMKKGTKVCVTDDTGKATIYQPLGEDFRWWLVTSPGGTQEVERTREDYYQAVEEVVVKEERMKLRSHGKPGGGCASPKKVGRINKKRSPPPLIPPPMPVVRYNPSVSSSSTDSAVEYQEVEEEEKVEDESEKEEEKVEDESEKEEEKVEDESEKEEEKVEDESEKEEKSPPQSPVFLSPEAVKPTWRRYPMRRRRRPRVEVETDVVDEVNLEKAIRREKRLVKYRTPELCKEENSGRMFRKRRRVEVDGSKETDPSEEKQEDVECDNEMKKLKKNLSTEEDQKKPCVVEDKMEGMIEKKRNVSRGGDSASRIEGIVKLMEAIKKPLYSPRKVARILPSVKAVREELARKKKGGDEEKQKNTMIVAAVPRNLPPRKEVKTEEKESKVNKQMAAAVIPPGDREEDGIKPLKNSTVSAAGTSLNPNDPRISAKKKREEEAKKQKNMVIAIYPLPPEAEDIPPPVWRLRKILIPRRGRRRRRVESRERAAQLLREQFSFFRCANDFSTDSPAEPDYDPAHQHKAVSFIPSETQPKTRVWDYTEFGWPTQVVDEPVEPIIAYSAQLVSPTPSSQEKTLSLPAPPLPPKVVSSTKTEEIKKQILPIAPVPVPTSTVQILPVPFYYPVPFYPAIASSPPPLPPLPATPPPPPPPPPPPEEELPALKTKDYSQKYHFIRIPDIPKKPYTPALPAPPTPLVEEIPPREDTPPPPGIDDQRPISPLGPLPQPLPVSVPLPVPAPTPQQLDLIHKTAPLPPSLLSLPLLPLPTVPAPTSQQVALIPESTPSPPSLLSLPLSPLCPCPAPTRTPKRPRRNRRSPLIPDCDQSQYFINATPTQFDYNYFNPSPPPPQRFDNQFFISSPRQRFNNQFCNPSPPQQFNNCFPNRSPPQQQFDNYDNPFVNPPPPPSNFFCNLSGYQYPGPPPRFYRF